MILVEFILGVYTEPMSEKNKATMNSDEHRKDWESSPPGLPAAMKPIWFNVPDKAICLDTETTGISVLEGHRLISIGAVKLENGKIVDEIEWIINPKREIDIEATRVHGFTLNELRDKPIFRDIAQEFLDYIEDTPLVIHNSSFDLSFLDYQLNEVGMARPKTQIIDTLELARESLEQSKSSNLDALMKLMGIDWIDRTHHGALKDCWALAYVYICMSKAAKELGPLQTYSPKNTNIRSIRNNMIPEKILTELNKNSEEVLGLNP